MNLAVKELEAIKELKIAEILERAKKLGLDFSLLDAYVEDAKLLAIKEKEIGATILKEEDASHDARYELLFDLILTLKPYIFNMYTVQAHKQNIKKASR